MRSNAAHKARSLCVSAAIHAVHPSAGAPGFDYHPQLLCSVMYSCMRHSETKPRARAKHMGRQIDLVGNACPHLGIYSLRTCFALPIHVAAPSKWRCATERQSDAPCILVVITSAAALGSHVPVKIEACGGAAASCLTRHIRDKIQAANGDRHA